ncbi:hypothetical protein [Niabella beijingensis]|uniref:hypothetical protein n=1 Tax=Niabella beijingensis TaxID=2872700 RepID=UPI001CC17A73|nr:hypothetical protein [Niabella beijingensis]MBZ4192153.1 hypothetical protein [Niabella beijingensis]
MKKKKTQKLKHWLRQYPGSEVNSNLRTLLTHYIGFFPDGTITGFSNIVVTLTELMELLDAAGKKKQ